MQVKRATEQPWWVNADDRPSWFGDLEEAFVVNRLCAWNGYGGRPHPQEFALVAMAFFRELESQKFPQRIVDSTGVNTRWFEDALARRERKESEVALDPKHWAEIARDGDRQAHVDALVEAGVLNIHDGGWPPYYSVVQPEPPHEHDWKITHVDHPKMVFVGSHTTAIVNIQCVGCNTFQAFPTDEWPRWTGDVPVIPGSRIDTTTVTHRDSSS